MNKDKIGLIKYVSILVVEMFLPLIWFGMLFLGLGLSESNLIIPNFIAIIAVIMLLIIPIIYFLLPIIATILAIKHHWSVYLDEFFNQLKLSTIILGIVMAIIIIYEKYNIMIDFSYSRFWVLFYYAVIPPYCLIYLVILIHNIYQKFKNKT
ncbi:hypothetical protein IJ674_04480 [bacterium]|jgi:hypothetical protein|nr:hypothetical protein [bacterium]